LPPAGGWQESWLAFACVLQQSEGPLLKEREAWHRRYLPGQKFHFRLDANQGEKMLPTQSLDITAEFNLKRTLIVCRVP